MAHAYTPGLRVTERAVVQRERRLPLKGEVVVKKGDTVSPQTIVARTELPGNVQTVNLAAKLAVDPAKTPSTLLQPIGSPIQKGESIAQAKALFGLVTHRALAPATGTVESVSKITGQLMLREAPIPVEVNAYVSGTVAEVLPQEGVIVESEVAMLQGIFGVGGETFGAIKIVTSSPDEPLKPDDLQADHKGMVVVGGGYVSHEALMRARDLGITAVVVGGFDDHDLQQLLGHDLGVAITGSEELGFTLVLTEGFGHIRMAERSWNLLKSHEGSLAAVSGATQIRAGVMRPEILIPHRNDSQHAKEHDHSAGLEIGSLLRVIREPYFGRIGNVRELPPELRQLDSEAHVRVLVVKFTDDGSEAPVPRANVELIAT